MSNTIWSLILVAALFGWIFSFLMFIFRAFPARGQFNVKAAQKWGCVVFIFFGIWIAGLLNA